MRNADLLVWQSSMLNEVQSCAAMCRQLSVRNNCVRCLDVRRRSVHSSFSKEFSSRSSPYNPLHPFQSTKQQTMGCTQSKTNAQEVVDPNIAAVEATDAVMQHVEENVTAAKTEAVEVETEPAPVIVTPAVEVKTRDFTLRFVPGEVSINEYGVAFYNFDGSNPADPSQEMHVCKRYSEFKNMHAQVSKLMASEKNVKAEDQDKFQTYPALPSMPRANAITYMLGRGNQKVVTEREVQFVKILNAVAAHPIALQSKAFTEFIA